MDGRRYHQRYRQPYGGWPCVDARDLVVKVKYGDTLKRFNASVNGSHFDLDLPALRLKIACAFKFSPGTEFILTYTDDDGDDVMLDDDNDLHDAAVNQKLNPLRIIVQLKGSDVGAAQTKQHTTNFSCRSTSLEDQLAQVKSAIDEALKFVPEQIPAVFAKLSHDLRSRAVSSAPSLAELLDRFAKLVARSSNMQPSGGSGAGSQKLGNSKAKFESAPMTVSPSGPSDMQNSGTLENGLKSVLLENPTAKIDQVSLSPSVEDSLVFTSLSGMKSEPKRTADNEIKMKIRSDARSKSKSVISSVPPASTASHGAPTQRPIPVPSMRESKLMYGSNPTYTSCGSNGTAHGGLRSLFPPPPVFHPRSSVFPTYNPTFGANGKTSGDMLSTFSPPPNIYPFEYTPSSVGTHFPNPYPIGSSHDRMASLHCNVPNPEEKSFGSSYRGLGANYGSIPQSEQHRWVQCDGCGVTPIVGPRYKSNVKEDYDLCGACFSHIGNEAEYTRLDSPASRCNIKILERAPASKTNSLFIKDITVPDGTPMAPSHPFTKIWRVRNNGSTSWPYGTQLVWVGGDHLASPSSVRLAISVYGRINPCEETDVTVDFLAPARPGRYISYWRLALPSGQRFGQQMWVHIKVEQPIQSSGGKQAAAMNLNQLPEANSTKLKPFAVDIETNRVSSEPFYRCPGIPETNSPKLKPITLGLETNSVSSEPFSRCPGSFWETMKLKESKPAPGDLSFVSTAVEPVQNPVESLLAPGGLPASEAFPQPNQVSSEPFYRCRGIPETCIKLKPSVLDSFRLKRETMKLKESKPTPGDMSSVPTAVEAVQNPVESLLASTPGGVPASEAFPQPNPVPMLPVSSSEPVVDHVSMRAPAATIAPVPAAPLPGQIINHLEEKLMTELEGLGFMQADLNKQILRQNNYDLEQSVAHLCDYDEWDALEFSELGFNDAEMNKEVVDNSDEEGFIVADLVTKAANDH